MLFFFSHIVTRYFFLFYFIGLYNLIFDIFYFHFENLISNKNYLLLIVFFFIKIKSILYYVLNVNFKTLYPTLLSSFKLMYLLIFNKTEYLKFVVVAWKLFFQVDHLIFSYFNLIRVLFEVFKSLNSFT